MTTDAMRRLLIDRIPAGARIIVCAPPEGYTHQLGARTLVAAVPLRDVDGPSLERGTHVIVEGLDALAEPETSLRAIARSEPARVYAIVANAANLFGLLGFLGGAPLAPSRGLIGEELPALFGRAGLTVSDVAAILDPRLKPLDPTGVIDLEDIGVEFDGASGPRLAAAAFMVLAAPA